MQTNGQIQFNNQNTIPTHAINPHWEAFNNQQQVDQAQKDQFKEEKSIDENMAKLDKLVDSSHNFFFSIKNHHPMDLFPDDLIVDIHKVTFINKHFLSKDAISIPIRDINRVEVTNDFLFASMQIVNGSQTTTIELSWLRKDEARQAQAIIQGLMIAYKNDLNLEDFSSDDILSKIETLGTPVV